MKAHNFSKAESMVSRTVSATFFAKRFNVEERFLLMVRINADKNSGRERFR